MNNKHDKNSWLLVDGHNMAFRCFYAVPEMTTSSGMPVNAIHGWIRSLWKLEDMLCPNAVAIFFDAGGSDDRRAILSTYKANRKPMPEQLKKQIHYLHLLSVAHGYYVISQEGVEADDLLGAWARKLDSYGETSYIASGDKDFAQCINENIIQVLPPTMSSHGTWRQLDRDGVYEKFGVFPEQIVDYLSLVGDTADNIRGVDGIGEKTAQKLLIKYGSIDYMLSHLGDVVPEKMREKISNSVELLRRNRALISLHSVPEYSLPEAKIKRSVDDIFSLMKELELYSLMKTASSKFTQQGELF